MDKMNNADVDPHLTLECFMANCELDIRAGFTAALLG